MMARKNKDVVETTTTPVVATKPFTSITVEGPLEDIGHQVELFAGQEPGRYVINYRSPLSTQSVSVLWDGSNLSL
jgi:hypothetical protein